MLTNIDKMNIARPAVESTQLPCLNVVVYQSGLVNDFSPSKLYWPENQKLLFRPNISETKI